MVLPGAGWEMTMRHPPAEATSGPPPAAWVVCGAAVVLGAGAVVETGGWVVEVAKVAVVLVLASGIVVVIVAPEPRSPLFRSEHAPARSAAEASRATTPRPTGIVAGRLGA